MTHPAWPFDQPKNCSVFTLRAIVFSGDPVLRVSHDADDHGWQFLGLGDADASDAVIIALSEIVSRDSTLLQVADLPPGWRAWRSSASAPWQRSPQPAHGA